MSPALNDGDYILTITPRRLRPGFIYIVDHPDLGRIVKRLQRIENTRYYFTGDNPKSTPSTVMGPIVRERITARAILQTSRKGIKLLN